MGGNNTKTQNQLNLPKGEYHFINSKVLNLGEEFVEGGKQRVDLFFKIKPESTEYLGEIKLDVFYMDNRKSYVKIGQSTQIDHQTLQFNKNFRLDYYFEKNQLLKFEIYIDNMKS